MKTLIVVIFSPLLLIVWRFDCRDEKKNIFRLKQYWKKKEEEEGGVGFVDVAYILKNKITFPASSFIYLRECIHIYILLDRKASCDTT